MSLLEKLPTGCILDGRGCLSEFQLNHQRDDTVTLFLADDICGPWDMVGHQAKKRRTSGLTDDESRKSSPDTSKPSAVYEPEGGRSHTLSIALPGSVIAKYVQNAIRKYCVRMKYHHGRICLPDIHSAQTHDSKTSLVGQIARACAVFCVDEIVVFDDGQASIRKPEREGYTAFADPNFFLYHVLTYLETPPQLRRRLFPMHPDLRTAGALPSLDMPHHLRSEEWCEYREGITTGPSKSASGTEVDCGISQKIFIAEDVEPQIRLTVHLPERSELDNSGPILGVAVAPDAPRQNAGYYWGYSVRQATSLGAIFTECPFDGGYDVSIGTSERGSSLPNSDQLGPSWKHLLVVFGGVAGLEPALKADSELQSAGVIKVDEVFDYWVNLARNQGSRTIRTEEAVWVALTQILPLVEARSGQ